MDGLIKQMRLRFSGVGQESKERSRIRDKRITPQKSQSFKGEKRKVQNWFRRLLSGQLIRDYDPSDSEERRTAVAAAAYAIHSLEESRMPAEKKPSEGPSTSFSKAKSKAEDTTHVSDSRTESRKFSEFPEKSVAPGKEVTPSPSIKKTPTIVEKELSITGSTKPDDAPQEKAIVKAPSIKKTPTLEGRELASTTGKKDEGELPKPGIPSTEQSALPSADVRRQSSTKPGIRDSEADDWEQAEMAKIKERYGKLSATINTWEDKKKAKARRHKDRKEAKVEKRRAKALRKYQEEMNRIKEIANGARAQAEKNRRNEELKVKQKANKFRMTGKPPPTCLCF